MLEDQNRKKDIFETVVLTVGSKFNDDKECDCENLWALCDCHAEAMCYRLAGLYMLTEMYKLQHQESSIFEIKLKSGYRLKDGVKFHLFTSYHPCGFMSTKDVKASLLSWKHPFVYKPHIPECSVKILIGTYLGIQGPLSSILVEKVLVSSILILHDTKCEKSLPNQACIKKHFERAPREISSKLNPEDHSFFPTITVLECELDYIQNLFPNLSSPYSLNYKPLPTMGFVLPKVIVNVNDKKKWLVKFKKQQVNLVSGEIKSYYEKLIEALKPIFFSFNSCTIEHRTAALDANIKNLTKELDVKSALCQQDKNDTSILEKVTKYEKAIEDIIEAFKLLRGTDYTSLHKDGYMDKKLKDLLDKLSTYFHEVNTASYEDDIENEETEKGKEGTKYLLAGLNTIRKLKSIIKSKKPYDTLDDIDCDWKRYRNACINFKNSSNN